MEKISWTDLVRNEEVLLRVKEQRNILHETSKRKRIWVLSESQRILHFGIFIQAGDTFRPLF